MGLADMLMPMLASGGLGAQQMPGQIPQQSMGTAAQQGSLMPFMDPTAMGQLAQDTADYQRRQQIANAMMSQGYVPNSGRFGVLAGLLSGLGGALANSQNQQKLSDIVTRQMQAESQAMAAKRQQDWEDLIRKTNLEVAADTQKNIGKSKAEKDYQKDVVQDGMIVDPNNPNAAMAIPGYQQMQIALAGGKANADAAARAQYAGAADAAKLAMIQRLMAQPDSPAKTAQLSSLLGEGGMQAMMFSGMSGGGGQGGPAMSGPTGDDFLKGLNPALAGQVKAIAEGRQQPPTSMAMRSPMGQALMAAVTQYDPTFDATNYAARSKTRNDFTSGNAAKQVNAMNTAIGHAGQLLDVADSLNNYGGFPFATDVNAATNAFLQHQGDPRMDQFNFTRDALAGEITKAFRGTSGSEKDIQEIRNNLSVANSPDQLKAAIGQAMKLLASKNESLSDQYMKGFGSNSQPNFLDPHAQAALSKLQQRGIDIGSLGSDEGVNAPAAGAAQFTIGQTATGPNGQKIQFTANGWVPVGGQ